MAWLQALGGAARASSACLRRAPPVLRAGMTNHSNTSVPSCVLRAPLAPAALRAGCSRSDSTVRPAIGHAGWPDPLCLWIRTPLEARSSARVDAIAPARAAGHRSGHASRAAWIAHPILQGRRRPIPGTRQPCRGERIELV